jgi:hypothetical protein
LDRASGYEPAANSIQVVAPVVLTRNGPSLACSKVAPKVSLRKHLAESGETARQRGHIIYCSAPCPYEFSITYAQILVDRRSSGHSGTPCEPTKVDPIIPCPRMKAYVFCLSILSLVLKTSARQRILHVWVVRSREDSSAMLLQKSLHNAMRQKMPPAIRRDGNIS